VRFDACRQRLDAGEVVEIDGIGAADGEGDAMHDQRVTPAYSLQVMQRLAAGAQVVLGNDLEPVDGVRFGENGLVMGSAKA